MTTMTKICLGVIVVLIAAVGFLWQRNNRLVQDSGKADARSVEQMVNDRHFADSLLRENAKKDSALRVVEVKSFQQKRNNAVLKSNIAELEVYADSLEGVVYASGVGICDSALAAKNSVIEHQKGLIGGLEDEAGLYVQQIAILKEIRKGDSVLIDSQRSTIEGLSCAYDWKIRHKFWAWIMGYKCNKKAQ